MNKVQRLQNKIGKIRLEIEAIESPAKLKKNKALIGKCFRYRNSYGSGAKWWLFMKVVSADVDKVESFQFQDDARGKMETKSETWFYPDVDGYEPISESDFFAAWNEFSSKFTNQIRVCL